MVRKGNEAPVDSQPIGGMRDPHLSVRKLPTVQALGKRTWAAWEEFAKKNKKAVLVAESYGTEDCKFDEDVVTEWKARLTELWDPPKKQGLNLKPNNIYYTPVDTEMVRGWQRKSGDPEKWVPYWLEVGAPLGIERNIQTAGIFPVLEAEEERHQGEWDSDELLDKGEMKNYKSVEEDREQAEIELERYMHGEKVLHGDSSSRSTREISGRHSEQNGVDLEEERKWRNQKEAGAGYAAQRRQLQIQAARAACAAKAAGCCEAAEVHASQPQRAWLRHRICTGGRGRRFHFVAGGARRVETHDDAWVAGRSGPHLPGVVVRVQGGTAAL